MARSLLSVNPNDGGPGAGVDQCLRASRDSHPVQRGLCLRQGDKLVFPSHCGRDRPGVLEHPPVFVSYAVKRFLDELYATLMVRLADCQSFTLKELWRDAATS